MSDTISIHLRFGAQTSLGLFQDTLRFTESEWARRDQSAIDAAKQALADQWVTFRTAQIADEVALKTAEGRNLKVAEIDAKIADLNAIKAALTDGK